ncbi:MAG: Plug domain-containing protein [Sphingobium sp.]
MSDTGDANVQGVPLTITAVSATQLEKAGVTGFRDLQTVMPGLTMGGQGTSSAPAIRGVSTNLSQASTENPTAVYIDGIYQTALALLSLDLPDVDRSKC